MADTLKSLGLCLGASTVSLVQVEQDLKEEGAFSPRIIAHSVHSHEGDAKRCLIQALKNVIDPLSIGLPPPAARFGG